MIALALLAQLLMPPAVDSPVVAPLLAPEWVQPGSGSRAPFVNVKGWPYFAPCDGTNDDSAALQAANDAMPAGGGTVDARACTVLKLNSSLTLSKPIRLWLGHAAVALGTSQILITSSTVTLEGSGGNGFGGNGTTLTYSGTAPAIDVGDGTNPIFHTTLRGLNIVSGGSAVASATAMGVRLRNSRYAVLDSIGTGGTGTGFEGGVGVEFRATASSFDATNEFRQPMLFDNLVGIHMIGAGAPNGANDLKIYGGFIVGHNPGVPANAYGIWGDQFSDSLKVYGTDVESNADNYHFSGTNSANHALMAARSEFPTVNHFYIGAGVLNVVGYGFTPESPAYANVASCATGAPNCYTDLGTNTQIFDVYTLKGRGLSIRPSANVSETFSIQKADGSTVFDFSTNGTPNLALNSGTQFAGYSGNFTPQTLFLDSGTGQILGAGRVAGNRIAATYGASVAINSALGNLFAITATNGTAFTVANPSNAANQISTSGQVIGVQVRNTSGGALGVVTWDTLYKLAAWTSPATGNSRTIWFAWDGTNWVEVNRTTADVPN